ncbi:SDR family NAD(P)-dependent oxidoreductase [Paenibacillus senegalimassiliensis]|uniref:SDR family NAD(P)-dependent oxidoreductase n=1 Tax=Paenibacillus senegalimassiliensis TaxID=1737426 RepID=UPI0009E8D4F3|nr:SDR family NAD(P)-dependent oxidoreductase [Paenibacillus senegalimassiliensis]
MSSFAAIRQLAEQAVERYERLDVLINNAGGVFSQQQLSQDGYEMTLAVNYLAPFLLTHLLLDSLRASGAGRIINVASRMQAKQLQLEALPKQDAGRYSGMGVYRQAKTALLMMTYHLANRLPEHEVTVNALHPGVIYTPQSAKSAPSFIRPLMKLVMQSPEQGAATSLYLATSPEVSQVTGNYYVGQRPVRTVPVSYDAALQQQLYEQSLVWTGLR